MEIDANRIFRWLLGFIMVIYSVILIPQIRKLRLSELRYEKSTNDDFLYLLLIFIFQIITLILFFLFPEAIKWADLDLGYVLRSLGFALSLLSLIFFLILKMELNCSFSPVIKVENDQELITSGIYSYVRHPIYSLYFMFYAGIFFLTSNYLIGISWLLLYLLFIIRRIKNEEEMLISHFGKRYIEYRERTGKFIPKLFKNKQKRKNI